VLIREKPESFSNDRGEFEDMCFITYLLGGKDPDVTFVSSFGDL